MYTEQDAKQALERCDYTLYNRILVELYGVEPVVKTPEIKGGCRVRQFDPNWFEYLDLGGVECR